MPSRVISSISSGFPELSQSQGQVAHVLLTRSPLIHPRKGFTVRLACVKHAASVRPEPGSNSPLMSKLDNTTNPTTKQGQQMRRHPEVTPTPKKQILRSTRRHDLGLSRCLVPECTHNPERPQASPEDPSVITKGIAAEKQ